ATSALWRGRESLARLAARLRMPSGDDDLARFSSWLNAINVLLGVAAYAITFVIVLSFESLPQRLVAASVSFAIPLSIALVAGVSRDQRLITENDNESRNQRLIAEREDQNASELSPIGLIGVFTWLSLLSAVLWGWAWLSPSGGLQAINRWAVVMVAA